ncbi:MAG: flagellar biosynthetic protein FliR [candidate division Zixibacteria bacterium 4484_95]|nr:MAG: flagellar biosynthetic protein FliR [candidate division Zixibacteria bacterium 4484_95]RKX19159.1 MAG: flagellar biosynthetic protein FliR [candidate division Zixibacteria bacterium]
MTFLQLGALEFEKLLFVVLRVGGIMTVAPVFGHRNIPKMLKISIIFIISIVILPTVPSLPVNLPSDLFSLIGILAKEVTAGLLIGFTSLLLFFAVQFGGNIIGLQMGFGIVNVIDPNSSAHVPIIGQFQFLLAILIFLAIDGHHLVLSAVINSFQAIPLGQINFSKLSAEIIVRAGVDTLASAIKLSAPCIVTLFLVDVAMGIVARTVPQMNIFIVGFPLKISIGLVMLGISFPFVGYVFTKLLQGLNADLDYLIMAMRPV